MRLALLLACLALLYGGLLAFLYRVDSSSPFAPDSESYILLASHLTTAGHFSLDGLTPSARREPLYPLLIASFMRMGIVGPFTMSTRNLAPMLALQIAMYLGAAWVLAAMARRQFGAAESWWTVLVAGLYLPLVHFVFLLLPEVTFILLVTLLIAAFLGWYGRWGWRSLLGTAVLAGLAGLIKAVMVFFPLVIAALSVRRAVAAGRGIQILVLLLVGLGLPALWTARNVRTFDALIVSTVNSGTSLYRGSLILGEQIPHISDERIPPAVRTATLRLKPHEADAYLARLAWQEMRADPGRAALQAGFRLFVLLVGQPTSVKYALLFLVRLGFLAVVLLHFLRHAWPLSAAHRIVLIYCVYVSVLYAAIYTTPRYFASCSFLLIPFFVAGGRDLLRGVGARTRRADAVPEAATMRTK